MTAYRYINLDYINEMAAGDNDFVIEMIIDYKEKMPAYIEDLNNAMSSFNLEDLNFYSHKLSSSFLIMGARQLAESAVRIVNDVKQQDTTRLASEVNNINVLFKSVVIELDQELQALTKRA
jgi:HPt (histidine-containing phosphotransfer) domain-containing protein